MRLPRLHAVTDALVLARADLLARAEALATLGPRLALHARDRGAGGQALTMHAEAFRAATRRHGARLVVNARPDIAAATGADGVQLGWADLTVADARRIFPGGWIGVSVHTPDEAEAAVADGADYLLAGAIFPTPSHPGEAGRGVAFVREAAALGKPVVAIGGITADNAAAVRAAGAWGVAAIRALWQADDPALAARALLAPWEGEA